jgi:hypothetical protein
MTRGLRLVWGVAFVVAAACGGPSAEVNPAPGVVLMIRTPSRQVSESATVPLLMSGGPAPERSMVVAASCRNIGDWMADVTLDNAIVVGSSPRLVRVAELIDGGLVDPALASGVEQQYWRNERPFLNDDLVSAGFDQADLDAYVVLLEQPPSQEARDRYVVYAATRTLRIAQVMYVDVTELPTPRLRGRSRPNDLYVAVDGVLEETQVSESECPK